jgi:hypothetical protein
METIEQQFSSEIFLCKIQGWLGCATIITNIFVILVILSDKELKTKGQFITLLAVGDGILGASSACTGFSRLCGIMDGYLDLMAIFFKTIQNGTVQQLIGFL